MFENKQFLKLFTVTAVPVVLQNLLQNSLTLIDTIMIGKLGEDSIAAVGIGSQVFFLVYVALFGIATGASIFMSQYWGAQDHKGIQKATGLGLIAGLLGSGIFSFLSVCFPGLLAGIFVPAGEVNRLARIYLKWVGASYMCTSINLVLNGLLRSTGDTKSPMVITFISMITDVIGNYLLIFVLGLGVKGAAIATLVARLLETVLLVAFVATKCQVHLRFARMFDFDRAFIGEVFKVTVPVVADDAFWAFGMTVYKMVYSRMGVDVLAATTVVGTIQDMFFVLQNGIGAATSVLIGNTIGSGLEDQAYYHSKLCCRYGLVCGVVMGIIMILTSSVVPLAFGLPANVNYLVSRSVVVLGIVLPVKFMNHIFIVGLFRAGGDTRFVFWLELASIWLVGVPLTWASGLVWMFPIWYVYLFTTAEEVFKIAFCIPRFFSRKWMNMLS